MRACARGGAWRAALQLLPRRSEGGQADLAGYVSAIAACAQARRASQVVEDRVRKESWQHVSGMMLGTVGDFEAEAC